MTCNKQRWMNIARGRRLLYRGLAGAIIASLTVCAAACAGPQAFSASTSYGEATAGAAAVWCADLVSGSTGATAALLAKLFGHLDAVGATHGDSGEHVWIQSASNLTAAQLASIRQWLSVARPVGSVHRLP